MEGKICQWKGDRGFGFIQPSDGSERLFFHISSVQGSTQRPQVGVTVFYEASRDAQQRLKADKVVMGVKRTPSQGYEQPIKTASPKREALDYILILVIVASLAMVGFQYYAMQDIGRVWYFSVPALVAFLLLNRKKRPKEQHFTCRGCRQTAEYDVRTVAAWRAGFTQIYCKQCHSQWLRNKPKSATQPEYNSSISKTSGGAGCLGALLVLIAVPMAASAGLYHWLV